MGDCTLRKLLIILIPLYLFLISYEVKAEEMISVRLVNHIGDTQNLTIKLDGDYFNLDPTVTLKKNKPYQLTIEEGAFLLKGSQTKQKIKGPFILIPEKYDKQHRIYIDGRPYLGAVTFDIEKGKFIRPTNQLPLEDYLKGVVPFEVFPTWDLEALKAQALAARTYAVSNIHKGMDDTIGFQVYGGFSWNKNTTKAVEETKGEVITYNNHLIDAFYSASNGGKTESNANVWGGKAMSYFPIKEDPYDPVVPWDFSFHCNQLSLDKINWEHPDGWDHIQEKDQEIASSIKKWLYQKGYMGDLKIVSIPVFTLTPVQLESDRSTNGSITIEFLHRLIDGTVLLEQVELKDVELNKIRPMLGGDRFKSYLIDSLKQTDGRYTMKGRGYGHGVGMSQWGASVMSEKGKTYQEIIDFYFPGTTITPIKSSKR